MVLSDELTWSLIKRNSCFLYKRNGQTARSGKVVLSAEPTNLMNYNSFKYSGLANSKAVGLDFAKDAKGHDCAQLSLKSSKNINKPSKAVGKSMMKKDFRSVATAIKKQTKGSYYRPELEQAALARWSQIHRAIRVKQGLQKPMIINKGRKKSTTA